MCFLIPEVQQTGIVFPNAAVYGILNKIYPMKVVPFIFLLQIAINITAQVPMDSLKGYYNFNGSLLDFSGNDNNITMGSGTFTADRFGEPNSAFSFNGINDSLVLPIAEFAPIEGDFTISFWYKTNSPNVMNLFSSKQTSSDTTDNFEIQLNSHSAYYLEYLKQSWYQTFVYWNGSGNNPNALGEGAPGYFTKGEWSHFLITRVADTFKIYRNHALYIFSVDNLFIGTLGDVTNMVFSSSPYKFKGIIDDLRLYNKAMIQQEVDLLWFEKSPFHFISPKPTDVYVQGSQPLIYWEYDATQVGDSINVDFRINNGSWEAWAPHSKMAYENAFYMNLATYPPGTLLEIRVADYLDTTINISSGTFSISEYDWVEVADSLPFNAKDGAGLLSFKNKMWLLGGWDPPFHPPLNTHSEVWSSSDGATWNFETSAPWPARHCSAWLNNDSLMWVIGGDPQSGCLTDSWQSADGINWIQMEDTIPGYAKRNNANYAYLNNSLFLFGGELCSSIHSNEVWKSADGANWTQLPNAPWLGRGMQINSCVDGSGQLWMLGGSNEGDRRTYNEVWKTADGITWTLVNESAPWAGRYWHTVAWFDNKMWLIGGMATAVEMGDVWYSEDGISWFELKSTTGNWPAGTRHAQSTTVFGNALWYMCGIVSNNVWKIVNTTVSDEVQENQQIVPDIFVYPNPAENSLTIQSAQNSSIGEYVIFNIYGQIVLAGKIETTSDQINVSGLTGGFYLIKLADNKSKLVKFIKL